jgi:hypothetical protein
MLALVVTALISVLLALGAIAQAGTLYTETTDFSDNPATPFLLPLGTSQVIGSVGGPDDADFFEFQQLVGGSPFTIVAQNTTADATTVIEILTDAAVVLIGPSFLNGTTLETFTGTVPVDGNLVVGIGAEEAESGGQNPQGGPISSGQNPAVFYSVTLAPEPGTLAILGLGLGGLLFYQRTRSKASTKKNSPHITDSSTPNPLWT